MGLITLDNKAYRIQSATKRSLIGPSVAVDGDIFINSTPPNAYQLAVTINQPIIPLYLSYFRQQDTGSGSAYVVKTGGALVDANNNLVAPWDNLAPRLARSFVDTGTNNNYSNAPNAMDLNPSWPIHSQDFFSINTAYKIRLGPRNNQTYNWLPGLTGADPGRIVETTPGGLNSFILFSFVYLQLQ
jgi:hypothetical protein